MKHRPVLVILLLFSLLVRAQQADVNAVPGQYIVQLKGNIDAKKVFGAYIDVQVLKCLAKNMNIWLVKSDSKNILASLQSDTAVKVAQHDHTNIKQRSIIPNDSLFNLQWNLLNTAYPGADISATQAWQINHSSLSQAGDSIVIAVVDGGPTEGFDIYHPDMDFFINHHEIPNNGIDDDSNGYVDDYLGWNVFTNSDAVYDNFPGDNHPTHVSGIAAAKGDNTIGIAGVSWGDKVLAVCAASNLESDVVSGYAYVLEMRRLYDQTGGARGAFIVATNSSFGIDDYGASIITNSIWCAMYDSLGKYGILSATAAPDYDVNVDVVGDVPTGCPSKWMIAVTNTTQTDNKYTQAAYGPGTIDIGAPGVSIVSCVPLNAYGYDFGTSMSSPHIAGAVADMIANACPRLLSDYKLYPDSIALILKGYMYQSVDPLNDLTNTTTTGGRLNLYHAFIAENQYNCNNCHFSDSLSQSTLACYGDSNAAIQAHAGTNDASYRYLWSTGDTTALLTGLSTGWYTVTITDTTGCQRQLSTWVKQPQPISLAGVNIIPIGQSNPGNVVVSGFAGNDTLYYAMDTGAYQVGTGGGTTGVLIYTSAIFVTSTPGAHTLYIANQYGCVYDTTIYLYPSGITAIDEVISVKVMPNPVSGIATLSIGSSSDLDATLALTDLSGRLIYHEPLHIYSGVQNKQLDLSAFSDGVYVLSLSAGSRMLASVKVLAGP
jgi:hypothetical protein